MVDAAKGVGSALDYTLPGAIYNNKDKIKAGAKNVFNGVKKYAKKAYTKGKEVFSNPLDYILPGVIYNNTDKIKAGAKNVYDGAKSVKEKISTYF